MKQKLFLCCFALLCGANIFAHDFEVGGIYYNFLGGDSVAVTYGDRKYSSGDYSGVVIIPSTISYNDTTYRVTSIGDYAFLRCSTLTTITIPESVTSIGNSAFADCYNLASITLPEGVTSIGSSVFSNCYELASINLPNGITSISDDAFSSCSKLISITIPESVTSIGASAFNKCENLDSITIPNKVTEINALTFCECTILKQVILPTGLISIGNSAFAGCRSLRDVIIPNSVTTIDIAAFKGTNSLSSITIGSGVTTIGHDAFKDSYKYLNLNYTGDISSWCSISFSSKDANPLSYASNFRINNESIHDLVIPDSVTSIGAYAFYRCKSLSSITIPKSIRSIGSDAFNDCSSTLSIYCFLPTAFNITSTTFSKSTPIYVWEEKIETLKSIPNWQQMNLQPIVEFDYDGISYKRIGNDSIELISKRGYYAPDYTGDINIPSVIQPGDMDLYVTSIGASAFYNCSGLRSVTIPESVATISFSAFHGCTALTGITIPNSVTEMGESAFEGCTKMRTLHIGNGLTEFPSKAFAGCTGLLNLTVRAEMPPYLQTNTFQNVSRTLLVHVPCSAIGYYKAAYYWNEFTNYEESFLLDFLVRPSAPEQGSTLIIQHPTCQNITTIFKAIPNNGYKFVEWNDGNTDNPRTEYISEDIEYVAVFASINSTIENAHVNNQSSVRKILENGTIYIIRGDEKYMIDGRRVE